MQETVHITTSVPVLSMGSSDTTQAWNEPMPPNSSEENAAARRRREPGECVPNRVHAEEFAGTGPVGMLRYVELSCFDARTRSWLFRVTGDRISAPYP